MQFWSFTGLVSYEEVRQLQLSLVDLRSQGLIPDTFLFLEHEPTITRGRGLQYTGALRPKHMPFDSALPQSIKFVESERGGDLTYHGPGQLVIYPICKLEGNNSLAPHHDVAGFIRNLEQLLMEDLLDRGLKPQSRENATGVWLADRKVASIGIAVRKWVTFHGAALNCVNDLSPFHLFSPCGFNPEVMTRLSDWVPLGGNWRQDLEQSLVRRIMPEAKLQALSLLAAQQWMANLHSAKLENKLKN